MKSNEDKLGYTPEVRKIDSAKSEVNNISSRVLDWMKVDGKMSKASAGISVCEAIDPDLKEFYSIHHPWSVYDLRQGSFEEAMQNLREELPKNGWKITKDGETKSIARNPEIVAVNSKTHHSLTIEWAKERSGNLKQMIGVDVNSRCYRAPEGTNIYAER
ncbi:hypothetical protein ABZS76_20920 [Streptomyces sp. NPDC005562]|uniref:hypothetical protein n=1 Tax=Streptomyces sp. NPDC005562 TaxID=3154890 RepID=UPI0033B1E9C8